jgi:hypothetical protein
LDTNRGYCSVVWPAYLNTTGTIGICRDLSSSRIYNNKRAQSFVFVFHRRLIKNGNFKVKVCYQLIPLAYSVANLYRSITIAVAVATLVSNTLSSILFSQLPDDPFHLASNFGWYLHFANILSVFGFIGALRVSILALYYKSWQLTKIETRVEHSNLLELPHNRHLLLCDSAISRPNMPPTILEHSM